MSLFFGMFLAKQPINIVMMEIKKEMDISQSAEFVTSVIPELHFPLDRIKLNHDPKRIFSVLVDFTERILLEKDWQRVNWTMQVIGYVYSRGNAEMRSGIDCIFFGAFERFWKMCEPSEWSYVLQRLPVEFSSIQKNVTCKE